MSISVSNVSKKFGNFQSLEAVNLEVRAGKIVALLGPSGSGKSTLLRIIAGLEKADSGDIYINNSPANNLEVRQRNIGFVFQHYALFKHLNVRQNIAFGLEIRKYKPAHIREKVEELLELIQLQGLGNRYPAQLSGGQRQRVALARALAIQPEVLLLDEPFGALDAKVRKDLRAWLRRLHERVKITSVFVTHDQEEAMEVADEIVVMDRGRIQQIGTPAEIYEHPATPFVMSFIGTVNVVNMENFFHQNEIKSFNHQVFIRPHDLDISLEASPDSLTASVEKIIDLGWEIRLELLLSDRQIILAHLNREQWQKLPLKLGQEVFINTRKIKSFAPVFSN